jgi:hypothetical protein
MTILKRPGARRLAAPFILSFGLLPACGGSAPNPEVGNPPEPEAHTDHDHGDGEGMHANPPAPHEEPATHTTPAPPEAPKP